MQIHPYLFFNGRCEEAMDFYARALGGEIEMKMRYRESPDPPPPEMVPPGWEGKIMHTSVRIGDAILMASDSANAPAFGGCALTIDAPDTATVDRMFTTLADGGKIDMPLAKTFWSPRFGMLTDRFGVQWMIGVTG